jgi:uncharacterized membrane protein
MRGPVAVTKETAMAELIVVGFKQDMHRASKVLNTLQEMNDSWVVDLIDGVAVYRDYKGRLRADQSCRMTTGQGAAWGALVGGIIGALVASPVVVAAGAPAAVAAGSVGGVALGAAVGAIDADEWKRDYGINEDFVDSVSAMVQPGDSAILALLRTIDPDLVEAQFRGYGGTILRTTVSPDQKARVEAMLYGR